MNIGKFCPFPLCALIGNFRIYLYIASLVVILSNWVCDNCAYRFPIELRNPHRTSSLQGTWGAEGSSEGGYRAIEYNNVWEEPYPCVQERKQAKEEVFGQISPARPGVILAGPSTSVGPSKSCENMHCGADIYDPKARTSMACWRVQKSFGQKTIGLKNFVPYISTLCKRPTLDGVER